MIRHKKELDFYLKADAIMNGYPEEFNIFDSIHDFLTGGGRIRTFLILMRKYDYYSNKKGLINYVKHVWYSMRYFRLGTKLGFSISPTSFGYGLVIPHNGTIVVGGKNTIGNYAVLHTSTCIASTDNIIGDGLYLATGAKIVKSVEIGNNVSIAANSVVNRSFVKGNCLIAGAPAVERMQSLPWWERDGMKYKERHDKIEVLKNHIYNYESFGYRG